MQYGVDLIASDNEISRTVGIGMLQHLQEEHEKQRWFRAKVVDGSDLKLFGKVAEPFLSREIPTAIIETAKEDDANGE